MGSRVGAARSGAACGVWRAGGAPPRAAPRVLDGPSAHVGASRSTKPIGFGGLGGRRRAGAPPPPRFSPGGAADADAPPAADEADDSFYAVLGVSPWATKNQIRRAYIAAMKEAHPDVGGARLNPAALSAADAAAADDAAVLLNSIYEILADDEARAVYDAVAGYAVGGSNPFTAPVGPRDLSFVDEVACIGCRACAGIAPDTFFIEEKFGRARVRAQRASPEPLVVEAMEACPVACIHYVTASQLTLLETTMARMERVAAWVMGAQQGGKAANINVFFEAQIAWNRRQSELLERERCAAAAAAGAGWAGPFAAPFAEPAAGSGADRRARGTRAGGAGGGAGGGRPFRGRDMVAMAEAARRWRDFQRRRRDAPIAEIPAVAAAAAADGGGEAP